MRCPTVPTRSRPDCWTSSKISLRSYFDSTCGRVQRETRRSAESALLNRQSQQAERRSSQAVQVAVLALMPDNPQHNADQRRRRGAIKPTGRATDPKQYDRTDQDGADDAFDCKPPPAEQPWRWPPQWPSGRHHETITMVESPADSRDPIPGSCGDVWHGHDQRPQGQPLGAVAAHTQLGRYARSATRTASGVGVPARFRPAASVGESTRGSPTRRASRDHSSHARTTGSPASRSAYRR